MASLSIASCAEFLMAGPNWCHSRAKDALMNEWFASTADVHRILEQLPEVPI